MTVEEIFCENKRCPHALTSKDRRPRFIGENWGGGGRWQCKSCSGFVTRGVCPAPDKALQRLTA